MPHRRLLIVAVSAALAVAACAGAAPAASPTDMAPAPTGMSTASPSPAASPTDAASATPAPTIDDSYVDDYGPQPTPTAPMATATPAGGVAVSAITYGELGTYLAGPTQMALYTFDRDEAGSSACSGDCATAWPPLTVDDGAAPRGGPGVTGELGTIVRDDGSTQVTYDGAPLYYYAGDSELYDVTGDGVGGVWHLARP